jgi:hypothetical protein
LQIETTLVGLNINEDKAKYMQIKRTGRKEGRKDLTSKN